MDDAGASRAALTLLDGGYTNVHVIVNGMWALNGEAAKRGLPAGPDVAEPALVAAAH